MLDVIILNAYHRGDWLIEKLKGSAHAIETLDISDLVGPRAEVDLHGPFGYFDGLDSETGEWLKSTRELTALQNGWTLWSSDGTYESSGPLKDFQMTELSGQADTVLKSWLGTLDRPAQILRQQEVAAPYTDQTYFLSKKFTRSQREARRTVKAADSFHFSSAPGIKTIKWNDAIFESQFIVSFLMPHELMALAPRGLSGLLTSEPLKPRLCWQRARFRIETSFNMQALPEQVTILSRAQDPWVEENLITLQKTDVAGEWDLWFRTWYDVHKEKKYFSGLQKRLQGALSAKITDATITCIEAPFETTERSAQTLYPIYDVPEWMLHTKWFTGGIFTGARDKCETFSATQAVDVQRRILNQIDEELKRG